METPLGAEHTVYYYSLRIKLSHPIHVAYSAEYVFVRVGAGTAYLHCCTVFIVRLSLLITFYTVRLYTMYSFT